MTPRGSTWNPSMETRGLLLTQSRKTSPNLDLCVTKEDACFCDLVHLVRQSFNSLTEVGRQNDMDYNHMLAIIEQKMCPDDRKVWSRFLESTKAHATLQVLMSWMTSEMKSRMRATAPLRNSRQNFSQVNQVLEIVEKKPVNHKCWLCKT